MRQKCSKSPLKSQVQIRLFLQESVSNLRENLMKQRSKCLKNKYKLYSRKEYQDSFKTKKMKRITLIKQQKIFYKRMQGKSNMLVEIKHRQPIPRLNLCHNKDKMTFQSMLLISGKEHSKMWRLHQINCAKKEII